MKTLDLKAGHVVTKQEFVSLNRKSVWSLCSLQTETAPAAGKPPPPPSRTSAEAESGCNPHVGKAAAVPENMSPFHVRSAEVGVSRFEKGMLWMGSNRIYSTCSRAAASPPCSSSTALSDICTRELRLSLPRTFLLSHQHHVSHPYLAHALD